MKSKKIIFFFLVLSVISSLLLAVNYFVPIKDLENITNRDRIVVFSVTAILFFLNKSYKNKKQLVPSSIMAAEKDADRNRDKPDVSFKDVAGLEEIKDLAKKTTGLSGAELANIANEAAIIAVRNNKTIITSKEFEAAIERVVAGLELKNPTILLKEKRTVAFHEAGHALVSKMLNTDIVQKISIIPRGQALGYVLKFPEEDRYLFTKRELHDKIICLLAGRAAEEIIFKEVTTGAKDDLSKATNIAREMVCSYGMTDMGNLALDEMYIRYNYDSIRKEIKIITDAAYIEAKNIINENIDILNNISKVLMDQETINSEELDVIIKKHKPKFNYAT